MELLVNEMKITSPKDVVQFATAKKLAYKEGHDKGKMLIVEFQGESVSGAKEKTQNALYKKGEMPFHMLKRTRKLLARGDVCVVAYLGQ